ncbi:MAG: UDP-N-acetylmuramoyl-L-alanine--D-glutamate ligase [Firmicutes bacterium]|nr:UDP-N-acetylmuramoyl-L-alanine--D-glutamate ligase [Bacillota bacterium]
MQVALVIGIQSSGISACALLQKKGYEVRRYDDNLDFEGNFKGREEEVFENLNLIIISPGIPNSHKIVVEAKKRGMPIISELELGARELTCPFVMITGTNGKTTTVDMVARGLRAMGKKVKAMGNIGYPVSQVILDGTELDIAVIEASSFQLEYTHSLKPKVSAFLNIAPDHIDRYDNYSQYILAKKRVFLNQTESDFAVLNYDSKIVAESAVRAKPLFVSTREKVGAFYMKDNYFYYQNEPLVSAKDFKLKGEHNKFNLLTALNIMAVFGAKREHCISLIREYKLLPHRIEYVSTISGKAFYNDSKGTNISACKQAIDTVKGKNVGLILGGSDKQEEFCEFFDEVSEYVKFIAVTGGNDEKIYASAMKVGFSNIKICKSLSDAVKLLHSMPEIETVLFSPASASFDRYSSYIERGNSFKELVYALEN